MASLTIPFLCFFEKKEHKRTSDALLDAQDRINHLSEQLNNRTEAANWELKKAINDRDQALNVSTIFALLNYF